LSDSSPEFINIAPVLAVDNLEESIAFYRDTLSFEVDFIYGDPPYFAIVRRDEFVTIHLSEREDTSREIPPSSVYVFVSNIDLLYAEFKHKGLEMFSPPEDQEYGMREFEVRDNNGHFVIFGEGLQEVSAE